MGKSFVTIQRSNMVQGTQLVRRHRLTFAVVLDFSHTWGPLKIHSASNFGHSIVLYLYSQMNIDKLMHSQNFR